MGGGVFGSTLGLLGSLLLALDLCGSLKLGVLGCTGGLGGLLLFEGGLGGTAELVGEALDASAGIDELLLARVERVAGVAKLDRELGHGVVGLPSVAAGAANGALNVVGVDALLLTILLW